MRAALFVVIISVNITATHSDEVRLVAASQSACKATVSSTLNISALEYSHVVLSNCISCDVMAVDGNCSKRQYDYFLKHGRSLDLSAPAWFIETVTKPFLEVRECGSVHPCYYNDYADFVFVNSWTFELASHHQLCWDYPKGLYLKTLATYALIFHNISSYTWPLDYNKVNRAGIVMNFAVALALPIQVLALLFGLYVIRRALKGEESHILVYHRTLVFTDIGLCIVSFLKTTYLLDLILLPVCFASPWLAYGFETYGTQLGDQIIDSAYLFANMMQSTLALDRLLSVSVPLLYRRLTTVRNALAVVLVLFLVNTLLWIFFTLISEGVFGTLLDTNRSTVDFLVYAKYWIPVQNVLSSSVIVLTFSLQAVCGSAVLCILVMRMRSKQGQYNLLPCYLLMGTCGLNLCSGAPCVAYYLAKAAYNMCRNALLCPKPRSFFDFLYFLEMHRHSIVSLLNSLGVCVHCVVSKRYRQVAAVTIRSFATRLRRFLGFKTVVEVSLEMAVGAVSGQVGSNRVFPMQRNSGASGSVLVISSSTQGSSSK